LLNIFTKPSVIILPEVFEVFAKSGLFDYPYRTAKGSFLSKLVKAGNEWSSLK